MQKALNDQLFTLAAAKAEITRYLNSSTMQSDNDLVWLKNIQAQIEAIHELGRDQFQKLFLSDEKSQAALYTQVLQMHEDNVLNIIRELNKLNVIVTEKQKRVDSEEDNEAYVALLSYLSDCIHAVWQVNKDNLTKVDGESSPYSKVIHSWAYVAVIVETFGGRYLPFSQSVDPLCGMKNERGKKVASSGNCHGYVKVEAKQIETDGKMVRLPRMDDEVEEQQQRQHDTWLHKMPALFAYAAAEWSADIGLQTDFRYLFSEMLKQVDQRSTFGIVFQLNADANHIAGIRYIPLSNEYEIFDPNSGIAVFDRRDSMSDWLAFHYFSLYREEWSKYNTVKGGCKLVRTGNQPSNAVSSIPYWPVERNIELADRLVTSIGQWRFTEHDNQRLKDADFIQRHMGEMIGLSMSSTKLMIAAVIAPTVFSLGVSLPLVLTENLSSELAANIFGLSMVPALCGVVGMDVYAAYCLWRQYQYTLPAPTAGWWGSALSLFAANNNANKQPQLAGNATVIPAQVLN